MNGPFVGFHIVVQEGEDQYHAKVFRAALQVADQRLSPVYGAVRYSKEEALADADKMFTHIKEASRKAGFPLYSQTTDKAT